MPRALHRLVLFLASGLVAALLVVPAIRANAAIDPLAMPDFASMTYGDAWDFSNAEDFGGPQRGWSTKNANLVVQNGMLSVDMKSFGELALVRGFSDISIPWGRDGSAHPIDPVKYRRLSFRMNAAISAPTEGQITWYTCGTLLQSCLGGMPVTIKPGWNTYDVLLKKGYAQFPSNWAGAVQSLTLIPIGGSVSSAHVDIDWIRLYQPSTELGTVKSVLEPDPIDGGDYASIVGGNAWDFSQTNDVAHIGDATVSWDGQMLHGQNAGPVQNDPYMIMPTPVPIEGNRFHRFSMRVFYDGGFSLADVNGGGMNGRLYWKVAGSDVQQTSQDFLIYPGWQTINFSMLYPGIIDETHAGARLGWANRMITSFRVDINEDRGPRNWIIDWVRLGSDNPFGAFDIARVALGGVYVAGWSIDPNTPTPNSVHVYVDSNGYAVPAARSRTDVAGVYPRFGASHGFAAVVPASVGTHRVCAYGINLGSGGNSLIGCKQVVVDGLPFGSLDLVARSGGGYYVAGWAIDPDSSAPVTIHVYVDSVGVSLGSAAGMRRDVGAVYPRYGGAHGFTATIPASAGQHNVCVYALNIGAGVNPSLGCRFV